MMNMISWNPQPTAVNITPIIPQILPALVIPRPAGSIIPASIFFKSPFPMIQAAMPNGKQHAILNIPNVRTMAP